MVIPPDHGKDATYYFVMQDFERPGRWKLVRSVMQPVTTDMGIYGTREEAEAALRAIAPPRSSLSAEIKY